MAVPAEILDAAMRLPQSERRELARQLLDSTGPLAADPTVVTTAWDDELDRRMAEFRHGDVALLTEDDVRDLLAQ